MLGMAALAFTLFGNSMEAWHSLGQRTRCYRLMSVYDCSFLTVLCLVKNGGGAEVTLL